MQDPHSLLGLVSFNHVSSASESGLLYFICACVCVLYLSKDDWLQAVCTISLNSVPLRLGRRLFHRGKQSKFCFLFSALFWPKFTCNPVFYWIGVIVLLSVWIMNEAAANCKIPTSRCFCSCSQWPTSSRSSGGGDIGPKFKLVTRNIMIRNGQGKPKDIHMLDLKMNQA